MSTTSLLANAQLFLIDGDGVLYEGDRLLDGAQEFVASLMERDLPFALMTNNSTSTVEQLAAKMAKFNLPAFTPDHIMTSAYEAVAVCQPKCVYIVGMDGFFDACKKGNVQIANGDNDEIKIGMEPDFVFVGLDRGINYKKLTGAMHAIKRGAKFVAASADAQLPMMDADYPGGGSIVAAVSKCTDTQPMIIGKPEPHMFRRAMQRYGVTDPSRVVMIGDQLDTDITGGNAIGMKTILLRTGMGKTYSTAYIEAQTLINPYTKPTAIVDDMHALNKMLPLR